MKTLKCLTICFIVCCLFTNHVFAVCPGDGCSNQSEVGITARFAVSYPERGITAGDQASIARIGDQVEYIITYTIQQSSCPIINLDGFVTLPNGTPVDLLPAEFLADCDQDCDQAPPVGQPPCGPFEFDPIPYTIAEADLGQNGANAANKVRTTVDILGDAVTNRDPLILDDGDSFSSWSIVIEDLPEICITKEACPYSKPTDCITYTYTIENCGEGIIDDTFVLDAEITSILDTQDNGEVEDLIDEFLAANGGSNVLAAGDPPVEFSYEYCVDELDTREVIENIVVAEGKVAGTEEVIPFAESHTATETVDLLHPELTLDVTCLGIEGDLGIFEVCWENVGDVPLIVDIPCLGISGALVGDGVGDCDIVEVSVIGGTANPCGSSGSASLECSATWTIPPEYCELPNTDTIVESDECEVLVCDPSFTVEKTCLEDPYNPATCGPGDCLKQGEMAKYSIEICNTSTCPVGVDEPLDLFFLINDPQLGIEDLLVGPVARGECLVLNGDGQDPLFSVPVPPCDGQSDNCIPMEENIVIVEAFCVNGEAAAAPQEDGATCCYECEDPEGCTPGFWKNHPDCWCDAYKGDPLVKDVWTALADPYYLALDNDDRKWDLDTDKLSDALRYRGGDGVAGAARNMLRHATAALLNSCSSDVSYPVSVDDIILLGNLALESKDVGMIQDLHTVLADFNEDSPCPIDAHCRVIDEP